MIHDDWSSFRRSLHRAECAVIVAPTLQIGERLGRLAALRIMHPLLPIILVTRRAPEAAKSTSRLRLEEIVWIGQVEDRLGPAVERARERLLRRRFADHVDPSERISPLLRKALVLACRAETPVVSVTALARRVDCDRRTLWLHWKRARPKEAHLKDFLSWLLLLRAVGLKTPGRSWRAVAEEIGVHTQTLRRLCRRVTGVTLSDARRRGKVWAAGRLSPELARVVFGRPSVPLP